MPDRSNCQPAIVGDQIYVCSEPFTLLCVNREDGRILWHRENSYRDITPDEQWRRIQIELDRATQVKNALETIQSQISALKKSSAHHPNTAAHQIATLTAESAELEKRLKEMPLAARYSLPATQEQYNGYTTATPTSDGKYVWAVFGNRVVVCYDRDGQLKWSQVLPDNPQSMWGHSSSPLLVGDKLIVSIEDIVALDWLSGKEIWRTRYGQCWGSPVRARSGTEEIILMANGRLVRAADGKVLTRVHGLERGSPVTQGTVAYYVGIGADAFGLPSENADKVELKKVWSVETKGGEFYASAVVHDGLIYHASTRQVLNVIDASTGELIYVKRLDLGAGPLWPSLAVAGKYVYVSSRDGTTLVLETGRRYKQVARNTLEFFISTPVFHQNRMYIRTNERLYCIGNL